MRRIGRIKASKFLSDTCYLYNENRFLNKKHKIVGFSGVTILMINFPVRRMIIGKMV
jgi:hypothetical protein